MYGNERVRTHIRMDFSLCGVFPRGYLAVVVVLLIQGTPFAGEFVENGHTISHLTIQGRAYVGLFGCLESDVKVKDLGVVDVKVSGDSPVGGLAGYNNYGSMNRCYSTGSVNGTGSNVGGLVGSNEGVFKASPRPYTRAATRAGASCTTGCGTMAPTACIRAAAYVMMGSSTTLPSTVGSRPACQHPGRLTGIREIQCRQQYN